MKLTVFLCTCGRLGQQNIRLLLKPMPADMPMAIPISVLSFPACEILFLVMILKMVDLGFSGCLVIITSGNPFSVPT